MRLGVRRPVDLLAGLVLLALAITIWQLNARFPVGSLRAMGPGYVPRLLAAALAAISLGLMIYAWLGVASAMPTWRPRPAIVLALAMLAFGLLIERAGLIVATCAAVPIAALAGRDARPFELLVFTLCAAGVAVVVFVWGLGQLIPVMPPAWTS